MAKYAASIGLVFLWVMAPIRAAGPSHVDITWMSIANTSFELGSLRILADGYFTRLPESAFSGGGGGLAKTSQAFKPDVAAVTRVFKALGGPSSVNVLLTGHSHFDHSFDTATWSKLTGARIIGSKTTCFQALAENVPKDRCVSVYGGEAIPLADGVTMRVVRWNPIHWDGLWGSFQAGAPTYSDPALEELLSKTGVQFIRPAQYMDKWRLDRQGVRAVPNAAVKQALGF